MQSSLEVKTSARNSVRAGRSVVEASAVRLLILICQRFVSQFQWPGECTLRCRGNYQMLKITHDGTANEQRWTLCGQLSGPWVKELRSAWERACTLSSGETCIVDLTDVTWIDERGENLLRTMQEEGAVFVARGVDMIYTLNHLQSKAKPPLRRSMAHLDCKCDSFQRTEKTKKDQQ